MAHKGATKPALDVESSTIAHLPPVETRLAPDSPREPPAGTGFAAVPTPAAPTRRAEIPVATPKPAPILAERGPPARRQAEEEKPQPPLPEPADVVHLRKAEPSSARWPWIPFTVGAGAAVGATLCALAAQRRYDALSDRTRSYSQAVSLKQQGESWQTAAFIASGVAVVGLGIGIWGFAASTKAANSFAPTVAVIPGGAMLAMTGGLP